MTKVKPLDTTEPKKKIKYLVVKQNGAYGIKRSKDGGRFRMHIRFTTQGLNNNCGCTIISFITCQHTNDINFPRSCKKAIGDLLSTSQTVIATRRETEIMVPGMSNQKAFEKYLGMNRFMCANGAHGNYKIGYYAIDREAYREFLNKKSLGKKKLKKKVKNV